MRRSGLRRLNGAADRGRTTLLRGAFLAEDERIRRRAGTQIGQAKRPSLERSDIVVNNDADAKEAGERQDGEPEEAGTDGEQRLDQIEFPTGVGGDREVAFRQERV